MTERQIEKFIFNKISQNDCKINLECALQKYSQLLLTIFENKSNLISQENKTEFIEFTFYDL